MLASVSRYTLTNANRQHDLFLGVKHGKNLFDPNATRPFGFRRRGAPVFERYSL